MANELAIDTQNYCIVLYNKKFVLPAKEGDGEAIMFVISKEEMVENRTEKNQQPKDSTTAAKQEQIANDLLTSSATKTTACKHPRVPC